MKKNRGLAIILFAILCQLCSDGFEIPVLILGAIGLCIAIYDDVKRQ